MPYVSEFVYAATGGISQMRLGNGRYETAKFNSLSQVIELGLGSSPTDTSLWKINYEYGVLQTDDSVNTLQNSGNIAKQTLTIPGSTFVHSYNYDTLDRISQAKEMSGTTQNWIQNFGYDRYGNRTSFSQNIGGNTTALNPSINANTNRFNSGQGFVYDANGNVTNDMDPVTGHARLLTFNADNKQTQVTDTATSTVKGTYYYDAEGKRVKKVTETETTVFVYSAGKLVAEYSTVVAPPAEAKIAYTTTDHLGSPRVITNGNGQVFSRRDFLPFGEDISIGIGGRTGEGGQSYSSPSDGVRQKFTGYQKDTETSLDFAEARMYENRFGRFTAVDPYMAGAYFFDPQSFNGYAYTGNNPVNYIDPNGLDYYRNDDGNIKWYDKNPGEGWTNITGTESTVRTVGPEFSRAGAQVGDTVRYNSDHTISVIAIGTPIAAMSTNITPRGMLSLPCPTEMSGCGSGNAPIDSLVEGANAGEVLDAVQTATDTAGLIPVLGEPADAVSGLISLGRGDYVGAGLSLGALAPVGGQAFGGAKLARRLGNAADTVGDLRRAGLRDAHHTIQNAAVRDIPGYSKNGAPGIHLPGPANNPGTPHNLATAVQRQRGGGTYGAERRIGYKALRRAGLSKADARAAINKADAYFGGLGVNKGTPTRIPRTRR